MKRFGQILLALLVATVTPMMFGDAFVNGGFEAGDFSSWTQGAGYWTGSPAYPVSPDNYLSGGAGYDISYWEGAIIDNTAYPTDPVTGLPTTAEGRYSARINNDYNDYSVGVVKQSVANYGDSNIYFAWLAVLEASHGLTDSDYFSLVVHNDTTNTEVVRRQYSSASAPGYFTQIGWWYSSGWRLETIPVTAGDDFTLSLLASDCPYTGHAGYVYLDGFGGTPPPIPGIPEPSSFVLLGTAMLGVVTAVRRRRRQV